MAVLYGQLGTLVAVSTGALLAVAPLPNGGQAVGPADADPDAEYAQREDLDRARRAADLWHARVADAPHDFEAAWKLARARYWLGGHVPEHERRAQLEAGIEAADLAIAARPDAPDGYFWKAANMGALAESAGALTGLRYRSAIRDHLEKVLAIDPAFLQGSADRALGRWYHKVPGLFGGSERKSEKHLRRSLTYNPDSTASLYFLAETLLERNKRDEARATLERLLEAPLDPEWAPEGREFKAMGRALLAELDRRR